MNTCVVNFKINNHENHKQMSSLILRLLFFLFPKPNVASEKIDFLLCSENLHF